MTKKKKVSNIRPFEKLKPIYLEYSNSYGINIGT